MASYLKSIFRGRDSTNSSKLNDRRVTKLGSEVPAVSSPTKSKHFNYLYAEPGSVPPAFIQTTTPERSNSLSAARPHAPSPLRYTYDNPTSGGNTGVYSSVGTHHTSHSLDGSNSKTPLYRTSSNKTGERPTLTQHSEFRTTNSSGSLPSSNQSVYSTNFIAHRPTTSKASSSGSVATQSTGHEPRHRPATSRASSSCSVTTQSTGHEPKSALRYNLHGADSAKSGRHAHVSFHNPNRPTQVHMHPLLSYGRIYRAPISFDIIYPPSSHTVVDRHTHSPIPSCTLTQSATDPPTYGRFILKCDKLPWDIIATAGTDSTSIQSIDHPSSKRFFIGSASSSSSGGSRSFPNSSIVAITNLDVLQAIHVTLSARITQAEWDTLGSGSRAQRKASRAYEKRCAAMGGGWGAGVKRVDFLGGKTKLIGIETGTEKTAGDSKTIGKLVFARP